MAAVTANTRPCSFFHLGSLPWKHLAQKWGPGACGPPPRRSSRKKDFRASPRRHENLMHLFFRALRGFVKPGGSVKVSSNSGATGVWYSDIMFAAQSNEFVHVETVPFLEWQLKDYLRSYGDRRDKDRRPEKDEIYKAQKAHTDMVYSFCYAPSGEAVPKPRVRYPPSKQDLLLANEGRLGLSGNASKMRKVEEVYELFLSYVKGIHIG